MGLVKHRDAALELLQHRKQPLSNSLSEKHREDRFLILAPTYAFIEELQPLVLSQPCLPRRGARGRAGLIRRKVVATLICISLALSGMFLKLKMPPYKLPYIALGPGLSWIGPVSHPRKDILQPSGKVMPLGMVVFVKPRQMATQTTTYGGAVVPSCNTKVRFEISNRCQDVNASTPNAALLEPFPRTATSDNKWELRAMLMVVQQPRREAFLGHRLPAFVPNSVVHVAVAAQVKVACSARLRVS